MPRKSTSTSPINEEQLRAHASAIRPMAREKDTLLNFDHAKLLRDTAARGMTITEPPQDARGRIPQDATREEIIKFQRLVDVGLSRWPIPGILRHQLDVAFGRAGLPSRLLLSNSRVREQASLSLIDVVGAEWRQQRGAQWFLITLFDDRGNALEYQPALDLLALRARFQDTLQQIGLDAIGIIEVQAVNNFPAAGHGRTLMFHGHTLGWTHRRDFDARAVEAAISNSNALRNFLGARTVRIASVPDQHRDVAWRAHYITKAPTVEKFMVRDGTTPSGWAFKPSLIRPDLAVRVMEALSQLAYSDVVFASGDGVAMQSAWLSNLDAWHAQHRGAFADITAGGEMAHVWQLIHDERSRRRRTLIRREPFDFRAVTGDEPTLWENVARDVMACKAATRRYAQRKPAGHELSSPHRVVRVDC